MKLKTGWLVPAVVSAFTLAMACGGSSDNNNEGGSGGSSAGKAGSSTSGGSSSTAGSGNSNGGSSSAGTASGGSSSNGGSAGSRNNGGSTSAGGIDIGFGGAGFDPSDFACDPVPESGSACEAGTTPCLDGTNVCYCQSEKWACTDVGGFGGTNAGGGTGPIGNIECPDTKPTSGTPCGDAVGYCPYGDDFTGGCACYQGNWACLGG